MKFWRKKMAENKDAANLKLLRDVAKDIIGIKFDQELIKQLLEPYYEIARKHDIRWGEKTEGQVGTTGANPEWTITKDFFLESLHMDFCWAMILDIPEDLKYCEEKKDGGD
jgi:hypothetical protein